MGARVTRGLFISFVALLALLLLSSPAQAAPPQATIWTDQADYTPGETVIIFGAQWQENKTIDISVTRPDATVDSWTTVSDGNGEFVTTYQLDGITGLYTVEATAGNRIATTTFRDGNRVFEQCRNDDSPGDDLQDPCTWQTGIINAGASAYGEGDSVAFRLWFDGLDEGSTGHTVTIRYDFTKQTSGGVIVLGYDFLTEPDETETATDTRCDDIPGSIQPNQFNCAGMSGGSANTISVPSDGFAFNSVSGVNSPLLNEDVASRETASGATREIHFYGAAPTAISQITKENDPNTAPSSQSEVTVTFTVDLVAGDDLPPGCSAVDNCRVEVLFGGHLARGLPDAGGWGENRGAASFPGGSLAMRLHLIDGDSSGAMNRAINPAAIRFTPTIATTIVAADGSALPTSGGVPFITVGSSVKDTATLSFASSDAGGTVTYTLFSFSALPSSDAPCEGGTQVFQDSGVGVTDGVVGDSLPFSPAVSGFYGFHAVYGGDDKNVGATSNCEPLTVNKAPASLVTLLNQGVLTLGPTAVSTFDVATLSGATATAGGSITFTVFFNDNTCLSTAVAGFPAAAASSAVAVSGNGPYPSALFTPTLAGTYYWIAAYSGDANNDADATTCGEGGEVLTVIPASPTLTTVVATPTIVGVSTTDTATLLGGFFSPPAASLGSITFTVFGPFPSAASIASTSCVAGVLVATLAATPDPVSANGAFVSAAFTPTATGFYAWIASYSGDANNNPVSTACADPTEILEVIPSPAFVTNSSFCLFDEDTNTDANDFRLIYTPYQEGDYLLRASNPGQYYFLVFFEGDSGLEFNIEIPYPFVTHGARPVQVLSVLDLDKDLIVPVTDDECVLFDEDVTSSFTISADSGAFDDSQGDPHTVAIELGDYGTGGLPDLSSVSPFPLTLTQIGSLQSGQLYAIAIHLDYGLKKDVQCTLAVANALCTILSTSVAVTIAGPQGYEFSVGGSATGMHEVFSFNVFKNDPGITGYVLSDAGDPLAGVSVWIDYPGGLVTTELTTDEEGFYAWVFRYRGDPTDFTVSLPDYGLQADVPFQSGDLATVVFYLADDGTGYADITTSSGYQGVVVLTQMAEPSWASLPWLAVLALLGLVGLLAVLAVRRFRRRA